MTFLKYIPLFLLWIKPAIGAVMTIEALFGGGLSGPEKKARVLEYLKELNDTKLKLPWGDDALNIIGNIIDSVVWFLNKYGFFTHNSEEKPEDILATKAAIEIAGSHNDKVADPALAEFMAKTAI